MSAVTEAAVGQGLEFALQGLTIDERDSAESTNRNYYVELIRNKIQGSNRNNFKEIPKDLFDSILELIWDAELLGADESFLRRILAALKFHFNSENAKNKPSDIQDLLEYKPTEIIGDKCTQILMYLCVGELNNALLELKTLKRFLAYPTIIRNVESEGGYSFLAKSLELFVNKVSGISDSLLIFADSDQDEEGHSKIPLFQDLPTKSQVAVLVTKCFVVRNYHHRINDRVDLLKEVIILDSSNYEWYITRAEMWRRKRRDSTYTRGKRPVNDEFELVAEGYVLAQENPFVLLSVMDCIIDCIRDSRGHFTCGKIKFDNTDDTMQFMKTTCRSLLNRFPNSVRIHSQISDYFCRFVSFRYFDVEFAEECLERAYKLYPENPKTTHRFGIFTRMSKGEAAASFDWFKSTIELDPLHYNAFMECIKNMIAQTDAYDVIKYIDKKLEAPETSSWLEHEILELLFYKGLVYFINGETEKTLQTWEIVCNGNQSIFRLTDLDRTFGFYDWDENLISTDKLRLWIQQEKDNVESKKSTIIGDTPEVNQDRKKLVNTLYSLMVGIAYPIRPPPVGLFKTSSTFQLLKSNSKAPKGSGDQ